jgi:hypothetical protein
MRLSPLSNRRHPGESFKTYQARRRTVNAAVKVVLKGKMAHVSSEAIVLPLSGVDVKIDRAILNQHVRDVTLTPDGKARVGRTKGVTYGRPAPKAKRPGAARRKALRQ